MKVLVLVQSIEKDRYPELIQTQKDTWDSVDHPQVQTVFYYPSYGVEGLHGKDLYIRANSNYYLMFNHFIEAIRQCLSLDWDYLFKTDNSTYVSKTDLVKALQNKPRELYYGGQPYVGPPSPDCNWAFLWGEGMAMSRDVAQYLVKIFSETLPAMWYGAEDMFAGRALQNKLPWDTDLLIYQYWLAEQKVLPHHVYRCRKDSNPHDFDSTIKAMKHIHHVLGILHNR
jgi:hypothetical protein